ncbi:hypothetical protein BDR07DRAFT_358141 [Suillus spraguei]|nr:hypothetical protein BDR07DRAFT_358141 [Suillus spraguei]
MRFGRSTLRETIIFIPLDIPLAEVSELSSVFQSFIERATQALDSYRQTHSSSSQGFNKPLFTHLVFYCWLHPTSYMQPGLYAKKSRNLFYFYVSSYITTLAVLICTRQRVFKVRRFITVGRAIPVGGKELLCEAAEINNFAGSSGSLVRYV